MLRHTLFAALALLAAAAHARPTGDHPVERDGCLTKQQLADLDAALKLVSDGMGDLSDWLQAESEGARSKLAQKALHRASNVVSIINHDLIGNASKVADEACGTCPQIMTAVTDTFNAYEAMTDDLWPGWRDGGVGEKCDKWLHKLLDEFTSICPDTAARAAAVAGDGDDDGASDCLSEHQKEELKAYIKMISDSLSDTSALLRTIAKGLPKALSDLLNTLAQDIDIANTDLVAQLEKIIGESCGSCSQIVKAVTDTIDAIEKMADDSNPGWRDTLWGKPLADVLDAVEKGAQSICPGEQLEVNPWGRCLNDDEKAELTALVTLIHDNLADTAKYMRTIANTLPQKLKDDLNKIAQDVDFANADFVSQIEKIVNEACGTCESMMQAVADTIAAIEKTSDDAHPGWRDTTWGKHLVSALDSLVQGLEEICQDRQ